MGHWVDRASILGPAWPHAILLYLFGAIIPPMAPDPAKPWYRWRPRFGLLGMVLFVLFAVASYTVYWNRKPWRSDFRISGFNRWYKGGDWLSFACFSPDGKTVLTLGRYGILLWDGNSGSNLLEIREKKKSIFHHARFSACGKSVVTVSTLGNSSAITQHTVYRITAWDRMSGKEKETAYVSCRFGSPFYLKDKKEPEPKIPEVMDDTTGAGVNMLRYLGIFSWYGFSSPDGTMHVQGAMGKATVFRKGEEEETVLRSHDEYVRTGAFRPDGKTFITVSDDRTARVWDSGNLEELTVLKGHTGGLTYATYTPDATRIVTASEDGTARVWSADSGRQLDVLDGHSEGLWTASCSPRGNRIVTASKDGTAVVWSRRFPEDQLDSILVRPECWAALVLGILWLVHVSYNLRARFLGATQSEGQGS